MKSTNRWTLIAGSALTFSLVWQSSARSAEYDPLDTKAVLSKAEASALEAGQSVLSDTGKQMLGVVADAYIPGLGATLGLSTDSSSAERILDAIEADGGQTRSLVRDFWNWAKAQNSQDIDIGFNDAINDISAWSGAPYTTRLENRDQLAYIVEQCELVLYAHGSGLSAQDRVARLHAYTVLIDLLVTLEAELGELNHVAAEWKTSAPAIPFQSWLDGLGSAELRVLRDTVTNERNRYVAILLNTGSGGTAMEDYLISLGTGTGPGGTFGQSDFATVRDSQFSPIAWQTSKWVYYVGHDPDGRCANGPRYCTAYSIVQGSGGRFWVDFDSETEPWYSSAQAAYDDHKAIALREMVLRGYGPTFALAEKLWDTWGLGNRARTELDVDLQDIVYEADTSTYFAMNDFLYTHTVYGQVVEQYSWERWYAYIMAFAIDAGIESVDTIREVMNGNPDYLGPYGSYLSFKWPRFFQWVHMSAMRQWPLSREALASHYAGQFAAKFAAID